MRIFRFILLLGSLIAVTVHASNPKHWDATLATLAGDRFVTLSTLAGPVLINFWSQDCPPCVKEFPRLISFAHSNPDWTVMLVATDQPQDARAFIQQHAITLPTLKAGLNVISLMRSAGNRSGGLPFTVAVRGGYICQTHEGEVSSTTLEQLNTTCNDVLSPTKSKQP